MQTQTCSKGFIYGGVKCAGHGSLVEVPDLEVLTEGKNMKNAIDMARDAMELTCVALEDHKKEIPAPSDTLDIKKGTFSEDGETILSYVGIDSGEYRRKTDTKTVRRNVALPSWLNYEAEHAGINVSRVLQEALMNVLNVKKIYNMIVGLVLSAQFPVNFCGINGVAGTDCGISGGDPDIYIQS